jgi:DNA-directed RNA polymerase specialized sigma24 family protein
MNVIASCLRHTAPALSRISASYTKNPSDRDHSFQDIALAIWRARKSLMA